MCMCIFDCMCACSYVLYVIIRSLSNIFLTSIDIENSTLQSILNTQYTHIHIYIIIYYYTYTGSLGSQSPSMRSKSSLSIACPDKIRERTMSDVNSLAFQMAEACLDSNSNPSTPKFTHRTVNGVGIGGMGVRDVGGMSGVSGSGFQPAATDYLGG